MNYRPEEKLFKNFDFWSFVLVSDFELRIYDSIELKKTFDQLQL